MNKLIDDSACIAEWRRLIGEFNAIIELKEGIKPALEKLREKVKLSSVMTFRQIDALLARISNFLSGNWGKGKEGVEMKGARFY